MTTFANYTFKTEDTSTERREINNMAQQYGGFYVGMNEDGQMVFEFEREQDAKDFAHTWCE
jgi:regulatory protein YycI of two-component signal transduction system YycFG